MKLIQPDKVDAAELITRLRAHVNLIVMTDGDRDHMNQSRLTCEQVQDAFKLMSMAADAIELWHDRCEAERQAHEETIDHCDKNHIDRQSILLGSYD